MHISIIDNERILVQRIRKKLEFEWYAVSTFLGYKDFFQNGDARSHLYLIDISLGDGSGFDIIQWLRINANCSSPIMIISWHGDSNTVIHGLNIGADDYMKKPLIPDELIARVKALMRRPKNIIPHSAALIYEMITHHPGKGETKVWHNKIYLTHKESLMLETLLKMKWQIIRREDIIGSVWWWTKFSEVSDNTINVTLSKLRKKIGNGLKLKTIYNEWYILE